MEHCCVSSEPERLAPRTGPPPRGPGRVVLIVGPSGSGKDTLIRLARVALAHEPDIVFPGRVVTRASSAPDEEEAITPEAFHASRAGGGYALVWHAHGLDYAVPAAIDHDVDRGRTVVINASRTVIDDARRRYREVAVVLIDAPADVRAARLALRARDRDVAERLARSPEGFSNSDADLVIMNTAEPSVGADRLVRFIGSRWRSDLPLTSRG